MRNLPQERTRCQDRIERGILLNALGHVSQPQSGRWAVTSETDPATVYNVTAHACDCPDSKKNKSICKHQYAAPGYVAALSIITLRKTDSINQIARIFQLGCDMTRDLPEGYQRTLQDEYARAIARLSAKASTVKTSAARSGHASAAGPAMLLTRDCSHVDCLTTRCSQGQAYGGIAI